MNRFFKNTNICSTITTTAAAAAFASINIINKPRIKWRRNKIELNVKIKSIIKNERERERKRKNEWMNQ